MRNSKLDHPHLIRAHDAGEVDGQHFLAMELIDGIDLARLVRCTGPLPVGAACEVVRQAALGLQEAHDHGLIHRDVKPSNLMLTESGTVKVLDLGLARIAEDDEVADLTGSGKIIGTGDFLAPEQAEDTRQADARSDIYGLGCTLFFLLTGKAPFGGPQFDTLGKKLVAHIHETPPSPCELRDDLPADLVRLLERMLAKNPEDRPQTAEDVAQILEKFSAQTSLLGLLERPQKATDDPGPPSQNGGLRVWLYFSMLFVSGFLLTGLFYGEAIVLFVQGDGVLVFAGEFDELTVIAETEAGQATSLDAKDQPKFRLKADRYDLRVSKDSTSIELETSRVTIRRGQTTVVEVHRLEKPSNVQASSKVSSTPTVREVKSAKPATITNTLGMKFCLIPAGEFVMGSPDTDSQARVDEKPLHRVVISEPFYLGRCEVTVGQFRQFLDATGYKTEAEQDGTGGWQANGLTSFAKKTPETTWKNPGFSQTEEHPVTLVTWNDAVAFCEWLSQKENRKYRLPTEAEWEYAHRAGTQTVFPTQKMPLEQYGWLLGNSRLRTWPVGKRLANPWGLYDTTGNVREWCSDWYAEDQYGQKQNQNPPGPKSGEMRVVRGSCFMDLRPFARSAWRGRLPPNERVNNQGFRVVCEVSSGKDKSAASMKVAP